MSDFASLILVGVAASARADYERIAALPAFARDARAFGFLYTAEAAACLEFAACLGDRLWLAPRRQLGLGNPHALLELGRSHRYERVVAVIPAQDLEASLAWFRPVKPLGTSLATIEVFDAVVPRSSRRESES
jgi:hypothetical protein